MNRKRRKKKKEIIIGHWSRIWFQWFVDIACNVFFPSSLLSHLSLPSSPRLPFALMRFWFRRHFTAACSILNHILHIYLLSNGTKSSPDCDYCYYDYRELQMDALLRCIANVPINDNSRWEDKRAKARCTQFICIHLHPTHTHTHSPSRITCCITNISGRECSPFGFRLFICTANRNGSPSVT